MTVQKAHYPSLPYPKNILAVCGWSICSITLWYHIDSNQNNFYQNSFDSVSSFDWFFTTRRKLTFICQIYLSSKLCVSSSLQLWAGFRFHNVRRQYSTIKIYFNENRGNITLSASSRRTLDSMSLPQSHPCVPLSCSYVYNCDRFRIDLLASMCTKMRWK